VYCKNVPFFLRYGSFDSLFDAYKQSIPDKKKRVGLKTFTEIVSALSRKGTYNQGLSYYYVDFLDSIDLILKMLERLSSMLPGKKPEDEDQQLSKERRKELEELFGLAEEHTKFADRYLRHVYYGKIELSCENGYLCAEYALGKECDHEHEFPRDHPLSLVLALHVVLGHVIEQMFLVADDMHDSGVLTLEEYDDMVDELFSATEFTKIVGKEMKHYAKHKVRAWWQAGKIIKYKRSMKENPGLKMIVMDHKNKLLPRSKDEGMSEYFSKSAMSICGAMVQWFGQKEHNGQLVDGLYVWFCDFVMENTTSQEARDLMPVIEAIRLELQRDYFVKMAGETTEIGFLSDNALVAAGLTPFIDAMNQQARGGANVFTYDFDLPEIHPADETSPNIPPRAIDARVALTGVLAVIVLWATWEAQTGKSELDTHFMFINKQLTKACLEGGIDYLDPLSVFAALVYSGGLPANTVITLQEKEYAAPAYKQFDEAIPERSGINSVHDMTFGQDTATHRFFSNLETELKEYPSDGNWPKLKGAVGEISNHHVSKKEPLFFAHKELLVKTGNDELVTMDTRYLPGRTIVCLMKQHAGVELEREEADAETPTGAPGADSDIIVKLTAHLDNLWADQPDLFVEYDAEKFPVQLLPFWAKQQNRRYLVLSPEVGADLTRMYRAGQGSTNKALRYNAERAVAELTAGLLKYRWDQRKICSVSKVKSFFGSSHRKEQAENDKNRTKTPEELLKIQNDALQRGELLLSNSQECVIIILKDMARNEDDPSLTDAMVDHFHRVKVDLLQDFIRARVLEDATSNALAKSKMPPKGKLDEAREGVKCTKTKKWKLSRWAWELRGEPSKAKNPTPEELDARNTTLQTFAEVVDQQPPPSADFMETLQSEAHNQGGAGIVEIFNQGDEDGNGDRDSDSENEPDEDDDNGIDSEEDED
jgi:hypothetical protein